MNNEYIKLIKPYLKEFDAYLVGGVVRDYFLNKKAYDFDIAINVPKLGSFVKNLSNLIGGTFVSLHEDLEIYRIVLSDKKHYFDFAKIEGKDIIEDLSRRDFAINAIAYDIKNDRIIDPFGGVKDIQNKIINLISEQNIIDDPLRIMRAFRFCATLNFDISIRTIESIKKHYRLINNPAKERLTYELMKMFDGINLKKVLEIMDSCQLIEEIFPYYSEIKKIPKNTHHHLDLYNHLLESVFQLEKEFENLNEEIKKYLKQEYGVSTKYAYLKLATFLHDFGKPETWAIEKETGRHRFIGHDLKGAELIIPVLKNLKFSNKQIEYISRMIKYHIYPSQLVSVENITEKAKLRFYNKLKDDVIDVILLAHADRNSALGVAISDEMIESNKKSLNELLKGYFEERDRLNSLPVLLNGYEVMDILNIKQSKKLGNILKELNKAQIEKKVITKDDAISFVKKYKSE